MIYINKSTLQEKQENMRLAALEYTNGATMSDVMTKYNICMSSIFNAIKRYNIPYTKDYGRVIKFNQNYFENIDTEDKAYWLGFIMADGTIIKSTKKTSDYNRTRIAISITDKEHLEKFKIAINYPNAIKTSTSKDGFHKNYEYCYINCDSIKMCKDLIKLGCVPHKTLKSCFPNIDENLQRHFIRGYFDGDGCISYSSQHYKDKVYDNKVPLFQITTEPNILLKIQEILMNNCNLNKTKLTSYKRTKIAYDLKYGGKEQVTRIYHYLYDNATIYLQRKYDKFNLLFS